MGQRRPDSQQDPLIGREIGGAYVIAELVGAGSMARVYRAEQTALGRGVAIKIVEPGSVRDQPVETRFYHEARAASAINHPNSVGVIDFGRTPDGLLYMVMELLRGVDVARLLEREGPLPVERACRIMVDVLAAVGEAHDCGVVHRDLKPENLYVERLRSGRDLVKVLDFGIASITSDDPVASQRGVLCGTPHYMAPEQIQVRDVDGRADLYAAGVVLFELVAGRVPFDGSTPYEVFQEHLASPVPDLADLVDGVPPALCDVITRALAKEPGERYASAAEMVEALQGVLATFELRTSRPVRRTPERFVAPAPSSQRLLLGRGRELESLRRMRSEAGDGALLVNLCGPIGVGKTRLLDEVVTRARRAGATVAEAGPHPSHAPVAYWPLRLLLRQLWQCDDGALAVLAQGELRERDAFAAAGVAVVLGEHGRTHSGRGNREAEVTRALLVALQDAAARAGGPAELILVVDDFELLDGTSQRVLSGLVDAAGGLGFTLYLGSTAPLPDLARGRVLELASLDPALVRAAGVEASIVRAAKDGSGRVLPLLLDQLQRLGEVDGEAGGLAEVIARRVERHGMDAQRLLQLLSVLGVRASRAALSRHAGAAAMAGLSGLDELLRGGLVIEDGDDLAFVHPHVRELVQASIPAAQRGSLHARAFIEAMQWGGPLEVRAWHAWQSGEVLSACALLEQVAEVALRRGDRHTARLAFRNGWERARSQLSARADETLRAALGTMARGLARELVDAGQLPDAEGVLAEQVELTEPDGLERARTLVELSRIALGRGRPADAIAQAGVALQMASAAGSAFCEASAHRRIAAVRAHGGERAKELDSLHNAFSVLIGIAGAEQERWEIAFDLAEAMGARGDLSGVAFALMHVQRQAAQAGSYDVSGAALLELALLERQRSNAAAAEGHLEEARQHAERAGDLALWRRVAAAARVA